MVLFAEAVCVLVGGHAAQVVRVNHGSQMCEGAGVEGAMTNVLLGAFLRVDTCTQCTYIFYAVCLDIATSK